MPPAAAAQERIPPLPFAYVGKVVRDGERYAVLMRGQFVLQVRPGDTIGGEYRVQSVSDERLLLLNLEHGVEQALAFGAAREAAASQSAVASAPEPEAARPGYEH
jgi:hypothetical protein